MRRLAAIPVLVVAIGVALPAIPAAGQTPAPAPPATAAPASSPAPAPEEGFGFFAPRERVPVILEGRLLFAVEPGNDLSAGDRAELISSRLIDAARSPASAPAQGQGRRTRVVDRGGKAGVWLDNTFLLWATAEDAHGREPLEVAQTWADTIEVALDRYRAEHSAGFARRAGITAAAATGLALTAHAVLWLLYRRSLGRPDRRASIEARLRERHGLWTLVQLEAIWVVRLLWLALWLGWAFFVLALFPQTRVHLTAFEASFLAPLGSFLAVLGLTFVAILAGSRVIDAGLSFLERRLAARPGAGRRVEQRLLTLGRAGKATLSVLLVLAGVLVGLARAGVNVNAVLAAAGLTSLAIGLGAQGLIKDVISGFFILIEDQFAVGDVIQVGGEGGVVERMSLRITQMRNSEGTLITIPNGQIGLVKNLTSEWSRVDLKIPVSYTTDLEKAMKVSKDVAEGLWREWPERILEEPQMLGVDEYGTAEIWLRLWIKTAPFKQWEVMREMRLRLKRAFDEAGIEIPFARRAQFTGMGPGGDPPPGGSGGGQRT